MTDRRTSLDGATRRRMYLFRHGAVDYFDGNGQVVPDPDAVALNDRGRAEADAMCKLFAEVAVEDTDLVAITAPDIAENGRVVPVEVRIDLPNPQRLALLSDGNPFPLLAQAHFTPEVEPVVSVRVKMGESANLIALAEADGKLYRAMRAVKVTAGGCGG